jgi:hypothetical protein
MAGSLDLAIRLSTFQRAQEMSADFIVALLPQDGDGKPPISVSLLRQCLAGNRNLENVYHADLECLLSDLKAIAAEHAPYPIRWTNPILFRELLAERRAKTSPVRSPFTLPGPVVQPRPVSQEQIESSLNDRGY